MGGGDLASEGEAEDVDGELGESGEIGEGAVPDVAVALVGFAEEAAGVAAVVGGGSVHLCLGRPRAERLPIASKGGYTGQFVSPNPR